MSSVAWMRLLLILAIVIGHVGFWIWLYNRVNALGLQRSTLKRLEKLVVAVCLVLPCLLFMLERRYGNWGNGWAEFWMQLQEPQFFLRASFVTVAYLGAILVFLAWHGPRWMIQRPFFAIAWNRFQTLHQRFDPHLHRKNPEWVIGPMTRYALAIPGNQILSLELNVKRLFLDGIDPSFSGMKIGHLSDIHLMGQISPDFTRHCADWLVQQGAELLVVSGDLVDHASSVPHLERALGGVPSEIPRLFVLGNHDRAHGLADAARNTMVGLGWLDAGERDWFLNTERGAMHVIGNELPWLDRHIESAAPNSRQGLILGISHSPDQFLWARNKGCHLLLCGHTHGGQVRVPGIGPIVAPSFHGSRYASGVFFQSPTVMHVTRGIAGTHPLRWWCAPEASLLEIA